VVIDLSRKPVFVNTDVCPGWIVVRTASNGDVDGILRRKLERKEHRRGRGEKVNGQFTEVEVEAKHRSKGRTLMECRLPVDHILRRRPEEPLPNPFEVATIYTDAFTKSQGSWRAQLLVERIENKNGDLWMVTVRDEVARMDIVTATTKNLDDDARGLAIVVGVKHKDDLLPLQRLTAKEQPPLSVWDRLRLIEYDLGPGSDDPEET